jgi:hypothetical protein
MVNSFGVFTFQERPLTLSGRLFIDENYAIAAYPYMFGF